MLESARRFFGSHNARKELPALSVRKPLRWKRYGAARRGSFCRPKKKRPADLSAGRVPENRLVSGSGGATAQRMLCERRHRAAMREDGLQFFGAHVRVGGRIDRRDRS